MSSLIPTNNFKMIYAVNYSCFLDRTRTWLFKIYLIRLIICKYLMLLNEWTASFQSFIPIELCQIWSSYMINTKNIWSCETDMANTYIILLYKHIFFLNWKHIIRCGHLVQLLIHAINRSELPLFHSFWTPLELDWDITLFVANSKKKRTKWVGVV